MFRRALLVKCWTRKAPRHSLSSSARAVIDRTFFRVSSLSATSQYAFSRLDDAAFQRGFAASAEKPHPAGSIVVQFPLAQTGEGILECELTEWSVAVGDTVEEFQQLCEVTSDKASVEITSRFAGTVAKLHHGPGDMVQVGEPLCDIRVAEGTELHGATIAETAPGEPQSEDQETAAVDRPPHAPEPASLSIPAGAIRVSQHSGRSAAVGPLASSAAADAASSCGALENGADSGGVPGAGPAAPRGKALAAPAVRRIAKELGVDDLAAVRGSGPAGRVVREDIERYLEEAGALMVSAARGPSAVPSAEAGSSGAASQERGAAFGHTGAAERLLSRESVTVPLRGYRRSMVKSMAAAGQVPHFHLLDELILTRLVALRARLREDRALSGVKLSFLPFILKAISVALLEFPAVNSSLAPGGDALLQHGTHSLGVAMDTPAGLVVPNVKAVQLKTLPEIARELARLQALAAEGRLPQEDLSGGTLTVSNIGSIGGISATPLVNGSEAAIVALGRAQELPRFSAEGSVVREAVMGVSWGADHRIVDGATLTRFSNAVKALLEEPERLLLHLK